MLGASRTLLNAVCTRAFCSIAATRTAGCEFCASNEERCDPLSGALGLQPPQVLIYLSQASRKQIVDRDTCAVPAMIHSQARRTVP